MKRSVLSVQHSERKALHRNVYHNSYLLPPTSSLETRGVSW